MNNVQEILCKYTAGGATLQETNAALKLAGIHFHLDPERNLLTEEEKRATTVGCYVDQANGFGLLDTGTGSLDKVQVCQGKLVNCDCGEGYALCLICGKVYRVRGNILDA